MQFNVLSVAKFAVSGVVGIGTGKIVGKIIKNNVSPETLIDKITVSAAAWVIGGIATERTKKYTNDTIDEAVEAATKIVNDIKINGKLTKVNRGEMTFEESGLDKLDEEFVYENNQWSRAEKKDEADNKTWKFQKVGDKYVSNDESDAS